MRQLKIPLTAATRALLLERNNAAAAAQQRLNDVLAPLYAQAEVTGKLTPMTITDVEPYELVIAVEDAIPQAG